MKLGWMVVRIFTGLALFFMSVVALAGSVTLTWTPPTLNEDGSPLVDLMGYRVYRGDVSGTYNVVIEVPDATATGYMVSGLSAGQYFFAVTAFNADDVESGFSNEVLKDVITIPNPPGNLTVVEDLTAFSVIKVVDGLVLLAVGTVPAGTQCDPGQSVNGHNVVSRDVVTMTAGTEVPYVVVANCS